LFESLFLAGSFATEKLIMDETVMSIISSVLVAKAIGVSVEQQYETAMEKAKMCDLERNLPSFHFIENHCSLDSSGKLRIDGHPVIPHLEYYPMAMDFIASEASQGRVVTISSLMKAGGIPTPDGESFFMPDVKKLRYLLPYSEADGPLCIPPASSSKPHKK
jgi:hypothetical protein